MPTNSKIYRQEWCKRNPDKNRLYQRNAVKKRYHHRKLILIDFKKVLYCIRCGEDHISCLDFHHRDPELKRFTITNWPSRQGLKLQDLEEEIAKCDVLCANCHRKLHYNMREDAQMGSIS